MLTVWKPFRALGVFVLAAGLAAAQNTISAIPGMVNYVEGEVSIGGKALTTKSAGSTELPPGQVLRTNQGKAELLLTPGVFLRLGEHSAARMISASLTDTRLELESGEALADVTELYKENRIAILDGGATTTLLKEGLYRFTANPLAVSVYDGKAGVAMDDSSVTLKKGRQVALRSGPLKAVKFDRKSEDPLYAWSSLRSAYIADASLASARTIMVNPHGWMGAGWYWNPWWGTWGFLPANGWLVSPFGYGFYSPWAIYGGPLILGRPGRVYRGFAGQRAMRGMHPAMRAPSFGGRRRGR